MRDQSWCKAHQNLFGYSETEFFTEGRTLPESALCGKKPCEMIFFFISLHKRLRKYGPAFNEVVRVNAIASISALQSHNSIANIFN